MSTKNNGEGAPRFVKPGIPTEVEPKENNEGKKKKDLPRFAVVPHRGKGRVLGYEGEGYFLVKIPKKPVILAHRRDLTFTNTGDTPPQPKANPTIPRRKKPQRRSKKPPQAEPA